MLPCTGRSEGRHVRRRREEGKERGGGEGREREREGVGIQFPTKWWLQGSNGPELRSREEKISCQQVSELGSSCSIMTPQKCHCYLIKRGDYCAKDSCTNSIKRLRFP